jgi:hypothetical protein
MIELLAAVGKSQSAAPAIAVPAPALMADQGPPQPARPPQAPRPASPAPAAAPPVPQAPPAPPSPLAGQIPQPAPIASRPAANVRFDVTITDTGGPKPVTKTLSMAVMPGNNNASIRASGKPTSAPANAPTTSLLNVDVRGVSWVESNAVRANVTVEYQAYGADTGDQPGFVTASATSVFYDGRKTLILSTADPVSDRKTSIEVTATIIK